MHGLLAGRFVGRLFAAARVSSCEIFLASRRVPLGTALALELFSIPETPRGSLQIRETHFPRHSERRKPRATTTTRNDVPSRPRIGGLERVLERARSL